MALKNITVNRRDRVRQSAGARAESMEELFPVEIPPKRDETPLAERADFSRAESEAALAATKTEVRYNHEAIILPRDRIMLSPKFGRRYFEPLAMEELRNSVAQHGILQPVLVRPRTSLLHPHITHELVAGYRRMDAAEHSGLDVVPVIERVLTDVQAAEIALIENLQRKNPSEVDIGYSLTVLKEEMSAELDKWVSKVVPDPQKARPPQIAAKWEHVKRDYDAAPPWFLMVMERAAKTRRRPTINWADVGQRVGLSERSIQYLVKIAKLPPDVQEKIQEEKLSGRQAREIAQLDDALEQRKMASQAMRHGWSGDEIAKRVAVVAGRAPEAGSTPVAELRELMNRGNPSQTNADLQALCARLPELGISASTQAALQTEARRWREHIAATDSLLDEIERLLDEVR